MATAAATIRLSELVMVTPRCSSLPPSVPALAARLARSLVEGDGEPALAGVPRRGFGPPVVLPLAGRHPVEALLGRRAPHHWDAVVVIAAGTAVVDATSQPVVVAAITGRSGEDRCLLLDAGGAVLLEARNNEGLVADAARRFLGRATTPPQEPVWQWWAAAWLREVAQVARIRGRRLALDDVVSCHPAIDVDEVHAVTDAAADVVEFVVERGVDHAHLTGWDGVRRAIAHGALDDPECSPGLASWFDAGAFCRYSLAVRPPLHALVDDLAPVLDTGVRAQLRSVLDGWARRHR